MQRRGNRFAQVTERILDRMRHELQGLDRSSDQNALRCIVSCLRQRRNRRAVGFNQRALVCRDILQRLRKCVWTSGSGAVRRSSCALASGFPHAIFAGRLMVLEATVQLRREYLAVLAAVDMRLTGHFFLWVIDVKRVLVRGTTFKVGRFQGFLHF
jgi:hypothetical protein